MEAGYFDQEGYKMMMDGRIVFLLLTGTLLMVLVAIAAVTLNKNRKQKLEEPKHRMLEDD
jgi:hypothetical protein